jgi:hypothetical protein
MQPTRLQLLHPSPMCSQSCRNLAVNVPPPPLYNQAEKVIPVIQNFSNSHLSLKDATGHSVTVFECTVWGLALRLSVYRIQTLTHFRFVTSSCAAVALRLGLQMPSVSLYRHLWTGAQWLIWAEG